MEVVECHPNLAATTARPHPQTTGGGLPTRMFDEEIWLNLTAPLKHQLDSGAVVAVDDCMVNKCVNALRWDGRGWWCAGVDGEGVLDVLHHHGVNPEGMFSAWLAVVVLHVQQRQLGRQQGVASTSWRASGCWRMVLGRNI